MNRQHLPHLSSVAKYNSDGLGFAARRFLRYRSIKAPTTVATPAKATTPMPVPIFWSVEKLEDRVLEEEADAELFEEEDCFELLLPPPPPLPSSVADSLALAIEVVPADTMNLESVAEDCDADALTVKE